jgi:hypothetical protein
VTAYKKNALPQASSDFEKQIRRALDDQQSNLAAILNRGINFDENVDSRQVSFTSDAVANAENTVAHTLGKVPTGYIVVSINKAAIVYNGGTAWTTALIYLKVNVATTVVRIIIF